MKLKVKIELDEVNYGWIDENFDDEVGFIIPDVIEEFKNVDLNEDFDPGNEDCYESINDFLLGRIHGVLVNHVAPEWNGWNSITFFFDYRLEVKGNV